MADCPHGLDTEWCQLCKMPQRNRPQPALGAADGPRVLSRFGGRCPGCGTEIEAGEDYVTLVDGQWVCDGCSD